jgi:hypothetical protein
LKAAAGGDDPPGMAGPAPPWLDRRDAVDDRERYARMAPEERLACFVEVCELARTILEERPDRTVVLDGTEPMPPAAEATWLRLVQEVRRGDAAR